jgi:predicted alpha/beta-fold hydrolase
VKQQWTIKMSSPFFYFELGGHLGWKSGSTDTILRVPFKIVSDRPALHSRWPLLLKIEISSNGQNCSILSQNVPKFELYKHNDELFNFILTYTKAAMDNKNFIPPFFYFELGGHLGWKSGSPARSSLAYIPHFCLKFFFQPIYTDYAN